MAYTLSESSLTELETCDPSLVRVVMEVAPIFNIRVIQGHRGRDLQNQLFEKGLSKVRWPNSKHNVKPSLAADIVPYPIDWNDLKRFYYLGGLMAAVGVRKRTPIRWGGDWNQNGIFTDQTFHDLCHFELFEP